MLGLLEFLKKPVVHVPLILLLAFAVYSNTFDVPFQFDDAVFYKNLRPRNISNIPLMFTEFKGPWASRPLLYATLSLNYYFDGLNTSSYHAVNLALHLINCILLYLLVAMTGRHIGYDDKDVRLAAVFSAALFALHPVQTESVTYIISRSMLLATAFYLSGMILFLRAATAERGRGFYIAGLFLASLLGMASRENFATFPIMLVLYDLFFISRFRLREAARHWGSYLPVLLSLGYLVFLVVNHTYEKSADHPGVGVSPINYFSTEFNVHWTYLRLLVLPINQNIDYDYPMATALFEFPAVVAFIGYLGLWGTGIMLAKKKPVVSFCVLWFLVVLLPISFGVTLMGLRLDDVIFEHRLYLPGAGGIVAVALGASFLWRKLGNRRTQIVGVASFVIMLVALSSATYARNDVWRGKVSLWEDVVRKSPRKARAHYNLGNCYRQGGLHYMAIDQYVIAISLEPNYAEAHNNLANLYQYMGLIDKAIKQYREALILKPDHLTAHYNIGIAYSKKGLTDKAEEHYLYVLKINPDDIEVHFRLGNIYMSRGLYGKAIEHFNEAIRIRPNSAKAYNSLANAYYMNGQTVKANQYFKEALRIEKMGR